MHQHQATKAAPTRKVESGWMRRSSDQPSSEPDRWMELQRGIGNQAASRLVRKRMAAGAPGILQRKCACGGNATGPSSDECEECREKRLLLQAKLRVGAAHDSCEQEADRVAEQVTHGTAPADIAPSPLRIQRLPRQTGGDSDVPASVEHALAQPGQSLSPSVQHEMESSFGHDFSRVRVHYDPQAMRSASDVSARAYTVGHDIVFGAGQFAPTTLHGRRLLAHELTHVVQQSAAHATTDHASPPIAARHPLLQRQPADAACSLVAEKDLSPRDWLNCVRLGKIRPAGYPLRFSATGVVATPQEVLNWAIRGQYNDKTVIDHVLNSHDFTGNQQARAEAQAQLKRALAERSLDLRRDLHREDLEWERFGRQIEEREAENARRRAAVEWAIKDYYERGDRLKPRGAELLTIEQAADAEREGRSSKPYKDPLTGVSYHYGQTVNRATFVVAHSFDFVIKFNDKYYFSITDPLKLNRIFYGDEAFTEMVAVNTEGINVAYGYVLSAAAKVASFTPLRAGAPVLETAGQGLRYDVEANQARRRGEVLDKPPPTIGAHTLVEMAASEVGGRLAGPIGSTVGKVAPLAAPFVTTAAGMEITGVIEKSYQAATQHNLSWQEILKPDFSIVDVLEGTIEGHIAHAATEGWSKGRDPRVPSDLAPPPAAPGSKGSSGGKAEPGSKPALGGKAGDEGKQSAEHPAAGTAAHAAMDRAVHDSPTGAKLKLSDGTTHAVAAYHDAKTAGIEFCSPDCSLLAARLKAVADVLPDNYNREIVRTIEFYQKKVAAIDRALAKDPISQEQADRVSKEAIAALRPYVEADPNLDRLLQTSVGELRANRAQLRKDLRHAVATAKEIAKDVSSDENVANVLEDPMERAKVTEKPSPGREPRPFLRGNFAHRFAEFLLGAGQLPRPNEAEVVIALRDGTGDIIRADRVIRNANAGVLIEIKPTGWSAARGRAQLPGRLAAAQREFPKRDGWTGRVVEYTPSDVRRWLRAENVPASDIPKIMRVLGF